VGVRSERVDYNTSLNVNTNKNEREGGEARGTAESKGRTELAKEILTLAIL